MIASEHRLALPAGYQLGKYRLKGVLGAGGFGITYLADDHSLGRRVAIKELLPNDIATRLDGTTVVAKTKSEEANLEWARERFMEEGRALAACEHPNVVHVYEMIEGNGTAYMVTKYEEGRSLADWLKELGRQPTETELHSILDPLLSGLEKVHHAGFLHRDIKPENIYITTDGRPLLLDFGSARQAITDRSAMLTSIVTVGYAPFEQYYEDGKQGPWSDIYAMAAVMYRCIHGDKPPEATRRLKNDSCLKLAKKYGGAYSVQFLAAIDKALEVEATDRPQSIGAWRTLIGGGSLPRTEVLATPRTMQERLQEAMKWVFAHPEICAVATGVIVIIIGAALWKAMQTPVDPHPKPGPIAVVTPAPSTPVPVTNNGTPVPGPSYTSTNSSTTPAPGPTNTSTPVPGPVNQSTPVAVVYNNVPPSTPWYQQYTQPIIQPTATPSPHLKPNPWTNANATPAPENTNTNPDPGTGPAVEKKLVGTWSAKVTMPSGVVTLHWEQKSDGHYSLTKAGEVIDSGTLAAADGQMHRVSDNFPAADVTYEFKSTKSLVTTDPNDPGPVTWTRLSSGSGSSGSSRSGGESSGSSHHSSGGGGTDWGHEIRKHFNIPHFGF